MKKPISYGTCGTSRNPLVLESVSLLAKNLQDLLLSILNLKTEKALGNKKDLKGSRYVGTCCKHPLPQPDSPLSKLIQLPELLLFLYLKVNRTNQTPLRSKTMTRIRNLTKYQHLTSPPRLPTIHKTHSIHIQQRELGVCLWQVLKLPENSVITKYQGT